VIQASGSAARTGNGNSRIDFLTSATLGARFACASACVTSIDVPARASAMSRPSGRISGYKPATAELQARDRLATAGLHHQGSKIGYMDQCTFGAVRPWGGRGAVRSGNPRISSEPRRRSGPRPVECLQSGLQEGRRAASRLSPLKLLAKRTRGRPWRSLRPSPLAPSLRLAISPRRRISQTVPFFHVPVRAVSADTRAGQSNPAAAKTADEAPPRLLDDASIMRRSSRSPAFGDLHAARVSRSRRWPRNFPIH
jgi:hypothetical protein